MGTVAWWVTPLVTITLFIVGGAITWGRFDQKQKGFCRIQLALEKRINNMEPKFMTSVTSKQCIANHIEHKKESDGKIDKIMEKMDEQEKEVHLRIDGVIELMNQHMVKISNHMGKVQGFMENNKGPG